MKKFWTLVKKDWRLNRAAVIWLLIAIVLPYGFWPAAYAWDNRPAAISRPLHPPRFRPAPDLLDLGAPLAAYVRMAAVMGLCFSVLAAAVMGAGAFAAERQDRSAEFLAMLPAERERIIASKLAVALSILTAAAAIELGVLFLSDIHRQWAALPELLGTMFDYGASGMIMFGAGWLLSTFMKSTPIAACAAIVLVGMISLGVDALLQYLLMRSVFVPMSMVMGALFIAGIIFTAAGGVYYTRRVAA